MRYIAPDPKTMGWLVMSGNSVVAGFDRRNDAAAPMAKFYMPTALREAETDAEEYQGHLVGLQLGLASRILAEAGVKVLIVPGGEQKEYLIMQNGGNKRYGHE